MANSLPQQIHNHLNCPPSRVKEILVDLASTKAEFAPDKTLPQLWEQEKDYYKKYGCSAFDAGYQGLTSPKN